MDISLKFIITGILFILIVQMLLKLIPKKFKTAKKYIRIVSGILSLISLMVLVMIGLDLFSFKENFAQNKNLIIISDNQSVITAIEFSLNKSNTTNLEFIELSNNNIQKIETNFEDLSIIREEQNYYKIIIISKLFFEQSLPRQITLNEEDNLTISKDRLIRTIKSNDPLEVILPAILKDAETASSSEIEATRNQIKKEEKYKNIKGTIIAISIKNIMENKNTFELVQNYQEDEIQIYPKTIFFKMISIMPLSIMEFTENTFGQFLEAKELIDKQP